MAESAPITSSQFVLGGICADHIVEAGIRAAEHGEHVARILGLYGGFEPHIEQGDAGPFPVVGKLLVGIVGEQLIGPGQRGKAVLLQGPAYQLYQLDHQILPVVGNGDEALHPLVQVGILLLLAEGVIRSLQQQDGDIRAGAEGLQQEGAVIGEHILPVEHTGIGGGVGVIAEDHLDGVALDDRFSLLGGVHIVEHGQVGAVGIGKQRILGKHQRMHRLLRGKQGGDLVAHARHIQPHMDAPHRGGGCADLGRGKVTEQFVHPISEHSSCRKRALRR